jgi:hypothetical protein
VCRSHEQASNGGQPNLTKVAVICQRGMISDMAMLSGDSLGCLSSLSPSSDDIPLTAKPRPFGGGCAESQTRSRDESHFVRGHCILPVGAVLWYACRSLHTLDYRGL